MPRPSPTTANQISSLLLAGCGPNTVIVPAMQYGMNVGDLALSNLFDATDDDQPIDPEAIRAKSHAVCVDEQLTEIDCTQVMTQCEQNIDLVYRQRGRAEASRRQALKAGQRRHRHRKGDSRPGQLPWMSPVLLPAVEAMRLSVFPGV